METLLPTVFISSFVMIWAIVSLAKSKNWFVNEADLQMYYHLDDQEKWCCFQNYGTLHIVLGVRDKSNEGD